MTTKPILQIQSHVPDPRVAHGQEITPATTVVAMTDTHDVSVTVQLPDCLEYVADAGPITDYDVDSRVLSWSWASIEAGQQKAHGYRLRVNSLNSPENCPITSTVVAFSAVTGETVTETITTVVQVGQRHPSLGVVRAATGGRIVLPGTDGVDRVSLDFAPGTVTANVAISGVLYATALPDYQTDPVRRADPDSEAPVIAFELYPEMTFSAPVTLTLNLSGLVSNAMFAQGHRPVLRYVHTVVTTRTAALTATTTVDVGTVQTCTQEQTDVVPSQYDGVSGLLVATLDHFSSYQVGMEYREPQVWKLGVNLGGVNAYRGAVNYAYPIAVPAMHDGLQPQLELGYSSAAADQGAKDVNSLGAGWSLDVPKISQGVWYDTAYVCEILGAQTIGCNNWFYKPNCDWWQCTWPCPGSCWETVGEKSWWYRLWNDNDFKLELNGKSFNLIAKGHSQGSYGEYVAENYSPIQVWFCQTGAACDGQPALSENTSGDYWVVKPPDGTRHVFGLDAQSQRWFSTNGEWDPQETRQNPVEDARSLVQTWHLRRIYATHRDDPYANPVRWSAQYSYAKESQVGDCAYRANCRSWDPEVRLTSIEYGNSQRPSASQYAVSFNYVTLGGVRQPSFITVTANSTFLWRYALDYNANQNLSAVRQEVLSGTTCVSLPGTTFEYSSTLSANLLTAVNNNYGGRQQYDYENDPTNTAYRRVLTRTLTNGMGWAGVTAYAYSGPCFNSAGATCYTGHDGGSPSGALVGYAAVTETVLPSTGSGSALSIGTHRFHTDTQRSGREFESRVIDPNSTLIPTNTLQTVRTTFRVFTTDLGLITNTWFVGVVTATTYPAGDGPSQIGFYKRVETTYDPALQGGVFYGQATGAREYDSGALLRIGSTRYAISTTAWILRPISQTVQDATGARLSEARYYYDGLSFGAVGGKGDLTFVQDVALITTTDRTRDVAIQYDTLGNKTQETLLTDYGTVGSTTTAGRPSQIHRYGYDAGFGTFVLTYTNPLTQVTRYEYYGVNGVGLFSGRGATFGSARRAVGPGGDPSATEYGYDVFGRLTATVKPGDSMALPTLKVAYHDPLANPTASNLNYEGSDGWFMNGSGMTWNYEAGEGRNGSRAARIDTTNPALDHWLGNLFAGWQAGHSYRIGIWVRGSGDFCLNVAGRAGHEVSAACTQATSAWRFVNGIVSLPADATQMLLLLRTGTAGAIWVDDAVVINPLTIETRQREVSGCAACEQVAYEFVDGLGRVVQARTESADAAQQTVVNTLYDDAGRAYKSFAPAFEPYSTVFTQPAGWDQRANTTTLYDPLGRTVLITNPDGTTASSVHIGAVVDTLDARGYYRRQVSNAEGRLTRVVESLTTLEDPFDTLSATLWATRTYQTVVSGVVENRASWPVTYQASLVRQTAPISSALVISSGVAQGAQVAFKVDRIQDGWAHFMLQTPDGQKSFALIATAGKLVVQIHANGVYTYQDVLAPAKAHTWYVTVLRAATVQGGAVGWGHVEVWERDNPAVRGSLAINEPALKYTAYRFAHNIYTGTAWLDNYQEFSVWQTNYTYNARGDLTQVKDALGNTTVITYDSLGRKTAMNDPDMGVWKYGYDPAGSLITQTDARLQTLWFGYDALNRLTQKRLNSASGTLLAQYGYDSTADNVMGIGRRTSISNTNANARWVYDWRGRVIQEYITITGRTTPLGTGFAYDALDRVTRIAYPNGEWVTTTYNTAGLPYSLQGWNTYVVSATYNVLGQPYRTRFGNGLEARYWYFGVDTYPTWGNTAWGRLRRTCVVTQTASGSCGDASPAPIFDLAYWYDAAGNIDYLDDVQNGGQRQDFTYDALNRLVGASTNAAGNGQYNETYAYDILGKFVSKGGATQWYSDTAHEHGVTHVGGDQRAWYDANGNMIQRVEISGAQRITYTQEWDVDNRLVARMQSAVTNTVSGQATRFWFDANGNRVRRTDTTATWLYVGAYFEIVTSTNQQVSYYLFGSQRVAVRQKAPNSGSDPGPVYWLHGDHLGSASMATNISGTKVSESRYKPFGEPRWVTGTLPTDKTFTGQRAEPALGSLMDYGARVYSPGLGRFLSADTIVPNSANPQTLNRFAYVNNNPIAYTDPTGHASDADIVDPRIRTVGSPQIR